MHNRSVTCKSIILQMLHRYAFTLINKHTVYECCRCSNSTCMVMCMSIEASHESLTLCCYVSHVASITICPANDIDVNDDDDDTTTSTVFIILFVLSLVVNILLAVVIIYFIVRLKKMKTSTPNKG